MPTFSILSSPASFAFFFFSLVSLFLPLLRYSIAIRYHLSRSILVDESTDRTVQRQIPEKISRRSSYHLKSARDKRLWRKAEKRERKLGPQGRDLSLERSAAAYKWDDSIFPFTSSGPLVTAARCPAERQPHLRIWIHVHRDRPVVRTLHSFVSVSFVRSSWSTIASSCMPRREAARESCMNGMKETREGIGWIDETRLWHGNRDKVRRGGGQNDRCLDG